MALGVNMFHFFIRRVNLTGLAVVRGVAVIVGLNGCVTSGTTPERQAAFREKFSVNIGECERRVGLELKLSEGAAKKFCECQLMVSSEVFTEEEMGIWERSTFGGRVTEVEAITGVKAMMRMVDERRRRCGY
jgi:hypothetical protein